MATLTSCYCRTAWLTPRAHCYGCHLTFADAATLAEHLRPLDAATTDNAQRLTTCVPPAQLGMIQAPDEDDRQAWGYPQEAPPVRYFATAHGLAAELEDRRGTFKLVGDPRSWSMSGLRKHHGPIRPVDVVERTPRASSAAWAILDELATPAREPRVPADSVGTTPSGEALDALLGPAVTRAADTATARLTDALADDVRAAHDRRESR